MPAIILISGATTAERVKENSKLIGTPDEEVAEIEAILAKVHSDWWTIPQDHSDQYYIGYEGCLSAG